MNRAERNNVTATKTGSEGDSATSRAVIERFVRAWVDRNEGELLQLLDEEAEWTPPQTVASPVRDRKLIASLLAGGAAGRFVRLETLQREVLGVIVDGDEAFARIRLRAETLQGKRYENNYAWYYRVVDGRVAQIVEYADTLHAARLGFLPLEVDSE
jgi:ketosteroid isomerase-like protein